MLNGACVIRIAIAITNLLELSLLDATCPVITEVALVVATSAQPAKSVMMMKMWILINAKVINWVTLERRVGVQR